MISRKGIASFLTILMLFTFSSVSEAVAAPPGKHAPGESHTYRLICTFGFGAAGIAIATAVANKSSTSYSTQAAVGISAIAAGFVGGYLIGRKIDKGRIPAPKPDPEKVKQALDRAVETLPVPRFALNPASEAPAPAEAAATGR
jgi:hypothetical protein